MVHVSNEEFLGALFGTDAPWAHVTDFTYDPDAIPDNRHLFAWKGDYASRYRFDSVSNQYFTISLFYADEAGTARRRKALYRATPVIVLDDVKEKLSEEHARMLPTPSWILETSPGSEQWGYILQTPATDRGRVENLLDGLVESGLCPQGKDPGMKGVTRYVRLPEGHNLKAKKMVNGQPFKCQMLVWEPSRRTTLEDLARPFAVNLDAVRRDQRVDGAADVPDHPLLGITDLVQIKEVRSAGRFDITCPWVDEHTGGVDNGAAVFTNDDGSIGFKCHHGACQHRTGKDLLDLVEQDHPAFRKELSVWKVFRSLPAPTAPEIPDFLTEPPAPAHDPAPDFLTESPVPAPTPDFLTEAAPAPPMAPPKAPDASADAIQTLFDSLRKVHPGSDEAKATAESLLKVAEDLSAMDKIHWHEQVRDCMGWSKKDLATVIKSLREEWFKSDSKVQDFFNDCLYVSELNQFLNWRTMTFMSVEGFHNTYAHLDADARKSALQEGMTRKVDKVDYYPGAPRIYEENGLVVGNMYFGDNHDMGVPGDVSRWLEHFDQLGWGQYKTHILQWMAFTLRHPEQKINHMIIFGSPEGSGKDFLLYPLIQAMGNDAKVIEGDALIEPYTAYLMGTKYLHINESELGDRREANMVANKLKPMAAGPPTTIRVRDMYTKPFFIKNLVNTTMTTNSRIPLRMRDSRRTLALWSDLRVRDQDGNVKPEWDKYWSDRWEWMKSGGYRACIHYLRNCVDLSTFRPGTPPPVTQFLRDIQEESKPPVLRTIEEMIERKVGVMGCDIVTIKDVKDSLRSAALVAPDVMYTDEKSFTQTRISTTLSDLGAQRMRGTDGVQATQRLWVLRDVDKYAAMGPRALFEEYEYQTQVAKRASGLMLVENKR